MSVPEADIVFEYRQTIKSLRTQLAAERERADALQGKNVDLNDLAARRYSHIKELEAALAEAKADSERLDWREANPEHGFGLYADGLWADGYGGAHKTYRAALDAAKQKDAACAEKGEPRG